MDRRNISSWLTGKSIHIGAAVHGQTDLTNAVALVRKIASQFGIKD